MARNVEVKARIDSIESLVPRARALADGPPEPIAQDDTFFPCANGRLKLRVFADGRGELIAYERLAAAGPKTSDYVITPVADPDSLRAALALALGLGARLVKARTLLRVGRPRVQSTGSKGSATTSSSGWCCETARPPTPAWPWRTICCAGWRSTSQSSWPVPTSICWVRRRSRPERRAAGRPHESRSPTT